MGKVYGWFDLKGVVHKLAQQIFFLSYAPKSTYFIIIILFDIEIEHKKTKNLRKCLCLWTGSNQYRPITHWFKNKLIYIASLTRNKMWIWTYSNIFWRVPSVRILVVTLLTSCHTLFRNIKEKSEKSAIYNSWTSEYDLLNCWIFVTVLELHMGKFGSEWV